jgi:hypothetical protein
MNVDEKLRLAAQLAAPVIGNVPGCVDPTSESARDDQVRRIAQVIAMMAEAVELAEKVLRGDRTEWRGSF